MNDVDSGEKYRAGPKSKVHNGMANHKNDETVLISELSDFLSHVEDERLYYGEEISKQSLEEYKIKFSENTVNIFRKSGEQDVCSFLSLMGNEKRNEMYPTYSDKTVVVMSDVVERRFFVPASV